MLHAMKVTDQFARPAKAQKMRAMVRSGSGLVDQRYVEAPSGEMRRAKRVEHLGEMLEQVGRLCKCLAMFPGRGHVAPGTRASPCSPCAWDPTLVRAAVDADG